ncbi:MAG: TonB-dependent receptor [Acidobacteria bacterium]|nr:TonB-dependent receptor [Acidobacteriota bacterium]
MQRAMRRYRWIARCLGAVAVATASTVAPLPAQESGVVRGTVTLEENGDFISGAVILVVGSGAFALTDTQGSFVIDRVPAGSYEVLAQRDHLTAGRQTVTVEPGGTVTADFVLGLSPVHEEVTVTASAGGAETTYEAFNAVTTVDSFDIARESVPGFGDALRNEPGIAVRGFGPGASRPIIRGFDGDRVLILEDGVRTGDLSNNSGDHVVTVDPSSAERIEIVRGPATLLYGSNAVGGVVNVITPHESSRASLLEGTRAQLNADLGSANAQAGTNVGLQHARNGVRYWAGGSTRRTGDYATPLGTVQNSATESANAEAGVGWSGDRLFASAGVTLNDGRYGVPFAEQFHGHHEVDAGGHRDDHGVDEGGATSIALDWQRRAMRFDVGLQGLANRVVEGVRLSLKAVDWGHDELEIEGGNENVGTRFDNRVYILRADVDQRQTERLSGRFGAWTQIRDFEAAGFEALAPRTDLSSFAAFAYEELNLGRLRVQFGGRVDRDNYRVAERTGAFANDDDDDGHEGHDHGVLEAPDARDRDFAGASASVGLHADLGAGNALVANLTRSHRPPAIEELYNFGPHVGTLSFDVGNPDLDAESTLGLDLSLRHRGDRVRGALNFFVYDIDNFIFGDRSDEVADNLPVYNILQGDSRFRGFDARGSTRLAGQTWLTLGLGYVDARLATGEPLPRIPPLRGTVDLDIPYGGFTLTPQLEFAARQADVFRGETETGRYSLVNVRASYVWPRQDTAHILSFTGYNLTNELYRNHSSYIKDLAPEMGRGVRASYAVRFH